jgi:DNA (cytosine-5)-methyltransferase 1
MIHQSDFNVPNILTKQLGMNVVGDRQKVRLSSNFLPMFGFEADQRVTAVPSLDGGFKVRLSEKGEQKVYQRKYNRKRTNKPFEAVVEFTRKELLSTFPPGCERTHVTMRNGELKFTPMPNRTAAIIRRFKGHNPLNALAAMTGGVDIHVMESLGINVDACIEWRPNEARDVAAGRDLTEVNALNCLRNGRTPRLMINEDVYTLDPNRLKKLIDEGDMIGIWAGSLQCDDFSQSKGKKARQKSIEDLSTSIDMLYPVLRQIETLQPLCVVMENVPSFGSPDSAAGNIFKTTLRRWGYHVTEHIMDARDHGGIQSRRRYHLVASVFPNFEGPKPVPRSEDSIWGIVERHLAECRDVTDSYAITSPKATERGGNYITRESTYAPTILKSQSRLTKDGCYIENGGRIYAPSEGLIRDLMGIPESFDTSWMASEQAVEVLGQSLDYTMHSRLMASVKNHLILNAGSKPIMNMRQSA